MNILAAAGLGLLAGAGLVASPLSAGAQGAASVCGPVQDRPLAHAGDCSEAGMAGEQLAQADHDLDTARQLFERIDRNGDGQITPEEWSDWYDTEYAAATASRQGSPAAD
jgi:EF hand